MESLLEMTGIFLLEQGERGGTKRMGNFTLKLVVSPLLLWYNHQSAHNERSR